LRRTLQLLNIIQQKTTRVQIHKYI